MILPPPPADFEGFTPLGELLLSVLMLACILAAAVYLWRTRDK